MTLQRPERGTPGLSLEVHVSRDAVEMRAAAAIPRVDPGRLRPPALVEPALAYFDRPASELVLDLRAADGEILAAFGWPAAAETFHTEISLRTGELAGSPMRAVEWEGRLRVPVDERVAFLVFSRTDVVVDDRRRPSLTQTPLAVFALRPGPDPGPLPPLPLPPEPLPLPWPLPPPRLPRATPEIVWVGPPRRRPYAVYQLPGGHVHEARTIVDTGDPADRFDIVIIGEGFTADETDVFDARADLLCHGLLSTTPFSSYRDRINVHAVSTVSVDSGITNVPAPGTTKRTYLSAEGFWEGKNSATFIGTHATWQVIKAVEAAIPYQHADLVIVIVNVLIEGGSAPRHLGLAFVTLYGDHAKFVSAAAHESAHVLGALAEEYVSCMPFDQTDRHPNEATLAEVTGNTLAWRPLAQPAELDAGGRFRAVHRYGDSMTTDCQPIMASPIQGMLGAFWGCMCSEPADPPGCTTFCDQRGEWFFRPMAECKMRRLRYDFCRVCSDRISSAILAVAP